VEEVEAMLQEFVEDYRFDPTAAAVTFGIEVRDAKPSKWHVVVGDAGAALDGREISLLPGIPEAPMA
jgi:hypothetical protein